MYDLLIAQNKLDNPCFDYQYDAKGYPYAVVSTNDEYTLSLVFNKYKNNDEDYEIVLEKYIKKSSTQSLVDFLFSEYKNFGSYRSTTRLLVGSRIILILFIYVLLMYIQSILTLS